MIQTLKTQVITKGKEITEFMDKNNIQIRGQNSGHVEENNSKEQTSEDNKSVLVSNN